MEFHVAAKIERPTGSVGIGFPVQGQRGFGVGGAVHETDQGVVHLQLVDDADPVGDIPGVEGHRVAIGGVNKRGRRSGGHASEQQRGQQGKGSFHMDSMTKAVRRMSFNTRVSVRIAALNE